MIQSLLFLFAIIYPVATTCFHQPPRLDRPSTRMTEPKTIFPLTLKEDDTSERPKVGILRVDGPDRKGIVAAFAQVLYGQ